MSTKSLLEKTDENMVFPVLSAGLFPHGSLCFYLCECFFRMTLDTAASNLLEQLSEGRGSHLLNPILCKLLGL